MKTIKGTRKQIIEELKKDGEITYFRCASNEGIADSRTLNIQYLLDLIHEQQLSNTQEESEKRNKTKYPPDQKKEGY